MFDSHASSLDNTVNICAFNTGRITNLAILRLDDFMMMALRWRTSKDKTYLTEQLYTHEYDGLFLTLRVPVLLLYKFRKHIQNYL